MKRKTNLFRVVFLITILAGVLRIYAAKNLYGDGDEPVYLKRAMDYSNFIRSGNYGMLASYDLTYEHPALYKILFGAALLFRRPMTSFSTKQLPSDQLVSTSPAAIWIMTDRYVSVVFGTLAVAALTLISPLAGLFLAVDTLSVKYTSEIYLEALPLLTSLLSAMAYLRWFERVSKNPPETRLTNLWLAGSALCLGLTAASKYIYCVVGIVIIFHFVLALLQRQISPRFVVYFMGWAFLSMAVFFLFDPYLWPDPINRLRQSIEYSVNYSQSDHVVSYQYPFWQPIEWLWAFSSNVSGNFSLNPRSAFIFDLDAPIFMLALLGLPRLFRQKRFFFYWLVFGLIFLFAWSTKWAQYTLIVLVPLSMAAAEGVGTALSLGQKFLIKPESTA
jgi:hypothetical protein